MRLFSSFVFLEVGAAQVDQNYSWRNILPETIPDVSATLDLLEVERYSYPLYLACELTDESLCSFRKVLDVVSVFRMSRNVHPWSVP